jgi:hypothetical protein
MPKFAQPNLDGKHPTAAPEGDLLQRHPALELAEERLILLDRPSPPCTWA